MPDNPTLSKQMPVITPGDDDLCLLRQPAGSAVD
jgi:hypothetical protein